MLTKQQKNRIRQKACARIPTHTLRNQRCEHCNAKLGSMPRHHPDIENHPDWVVLLCDSCHRKADIKLGKHHPHPLHAKPQWWRRVRYNPFPCLRSAGNGPFLVHLIGPPGCGKSQLLDEYKGLRPDVQVVHVQDYRHREFDLARALAVAQHAIVDSSGLNRHVVRACAQIVHRQARRAACVRINCAKHYYKRNIMTSGEQPEFGTVETLIEFADKCEALLPIKHPAATVIEYHPTSMLFQFKSIIDELEGEEVRRYVRLL